MGFFFVDGHFLSLLSATTMIAMSRGRRAPLAFGGALSQGSASYAARRRMSR